MHSQSVLDDAAIPSLPRHHAGARFRMQLGTASLAYARVGALSRSAPAHGAGLKPDAARARSGGQAAGPDMAPAGQARASLGAFEMVAFSTGFGAMMVLMVGSGFLFGAG